uniref:Ferritin n=1 Tax=Monopterus albus TaxID=43700 RepID=A0A3Q3JKR6_MONAL
MYELPSRATVTRCKVEEALGQTNMVGLTRDYWTSQSIATTIKPERDEWGSGLEAMQCALQLEKKVNQALLDLHKLATQYADPHLCDFLERHYLNEQVEHMKKLGDYITNLTQMDASTNKMAEYLFDKHTLEGKS